MVKMLCTIIKAVGNSEFILALISATTVVHEISLCGINELVQTMFEIWFLTPVLSFWLRIIRWFTGLSLVFNFLFLLFPNCFYMLCFTNKRAIQNSNTLKLHPRISAKSYENNESVKSYKINESNEPNLES